MQVIENEESVFFDVDYTLIEWCYGGLPEPRCLSIEHSGVTRYVKPIKANIEALKTLSNAGKAVVVWSRGGVDWAYLVVVTLKLSEYVDVVIVKPFHYYDDLDANHFMKRIHLEPNVIPKFKE